MRAIVLAAVLVVASQAPARAQGSLAQVPQSISRSAAATAPAQIAGPVIGRDRAAVVQVPASLAERQGATTTAEEAGASPASALGVVLPPPARQAGSVDADEIARLLARGDAATIDAAAALALGATTGAPTSSEDILDERKMRARAAFDNAFVKGDK